MPRRKIRVGIIGASVRYGWGATAHLPALRELPDLELVAVCTTRRETAEESARYYGAPLAFWNPEEMVAHPDVDLVTVCTRAPSHHALVKLALNAGKHVYCEWPLGAALSQAVELRDLAEAKKVRHMVGLQARGAPVFNFVKELVADGYVGDVLSCTLGAALPGAGRRIATFPEGVDRAMGVGTLAISGGHSLDALCFCLGEFRELSAVVSTQVKKALVVETGAVLDVTAPDNVAVSGVLESGAVVSAHIRSVPAHAAGFMLEVQGTGGALVVTSEGSAQSGELALRGARKGDRRLEPLPVPERYRWAPAGVPAGPPYNVAQMYQRFAEGIEDGRAVDPDFNLAVTRRRMLDAIQRASDTGQRQILQRESR